MMLAPYVGYTQSEIDVATIETKSNVKYRVQLCSKTSLESSNFQGLHLKYRGSVEEVQFGDATLYRYLIYGESETLESAREILSEALVYFQDAFIVKYINEERYN